MSKVYDVYTKVEGLMLSFRLPLGGSGRRTRGRCRRRCRFVPSSNCQSLTYLLTLTLLGGFVLQLLPVYPRLKFVVQDRSENVKQGETEIFPCEAPDALASGKVTFMAHDFFHENPVKGADVYWLRGIL